MNVMGLECTHDYSRINPQQHWRIEMSQGNKDAALELAKECRAERFNIGLDYHEWRTQFTDNQLEANYNAARKPLEEERDKAIKRSQTYFTEMCDVIEKHDKQYQQLLITQEAYQRVVEALQDSNGILAWIPRSDASGQVIKNELALANPPSLEALEKHDQNMKVAALGEAWVLWELDLLLEERKAKLEKL
jgi:antirestriction protein